MRLELACWGGLFYYLFKEESLVKHTVLVQDHAGREAFINLETADLEADFQRPNTLSANKIAEAKRMIREFRDDFLDYWNQMKAASSNDF